MSFVARRRSHPRELTRLEIVVLARADAGGYIVRLTPIYPPSTVVEDKESHTPIPTHTPLMKLSR